MKNCLRFLMAAVIAVLILNTLPATAQAQAQSVSFAMTAPDTGLNHGDTVTVTLTAGTDFFARGIGITMGYDNTVLQYVSGEARVLPFGLSEPRELAGNMGLRLSFAPVEEAVTIAGGTTLAELTFTCIQPTDHTTITMVSGYGFDAELDPLQVEKAAPLTLQVLEVPVEGVTLSHRYLNVELDTSRTLTANVLPQGASDDKVTWESSDPDVVSVDEDGVLTGMKVGTAQITVRAKQFSAVCDVTVKDAPNAGYVLEMPALEPFYMDEFIQVSPVISNDSESRFDAIHMVLTYDPAALMLNTSEIPNMTLSGDVPGTVEILGYGQNKNLDQPPFTLKFIPLKPAESNITVVTARVDKADNAILDDTAKASVTKDKTTINVLGYSVVLPQGFTGDSVVIPGVNYTFEALNKNYNYTFANSTMGGAEVTVTETEDGKFLVKEVTGKLVLREQKTGKCHNVEFKGNASGDLRGNGVAQYDVDYSLKLQKTPGYSYSVSITVGGKPIRYDSTEDTITIPGESITADVVITADKREIRPDEPEPIYYSVTFEGSGAGAAEGSTTAAAGGSYSFSLNRQENFRYSVSYTMGDEEPQVLKPVNNVYTINRVIGNVTITVEQETDTGRFTVNVYDYARLANGNALYLVLAQGDIDDTKTFYYDNVPMYYRESYEGWCILTESDEKLEQYEAKSKVTLADGAPLLLDSLPGDLNMTGVVNINDAQFAYDIYNALYNIGDSEDALAADDPDNTALVIDMERFLNADVNGDKRVKVSDAAKAASLIPGPENGG